MRLAEVEGVGTLEFPDDTSDEVIHRVVKEQVRKRNVEADKARLQDELVNDPSQSPFMIGIGRGMMDIVQGIRQLAGADTSNVPGDLESYQKLSEAHPFAAGAGRILGNAAFTPIPGGVGATAGARLGTAALSGAAQAGLMYTPEGESRLANMGQGAALGAATQGLLGEPLRALGQGAASTTEQAAERADVVEAGKRLGVPVYHPDVTSNPFAKEAAVLAERGGPLGTAAGRLRQASAAKEAAQTQLAAMHGNYQLGDISDEIRGSLQKQFDRFQQAKTLKYKRAAQVADLAGPISTPRLDATVQQAIQDAGSAGIPNPQLISRLEAIQKAPRGPFSIANQLDDDLGDEVSKFYTGENAAVGKKGVQYFQQAKEALKADIRDHLQKNRPGAIPLMDEADKFYQDNILPFKKTQLGKIISDKADFNPEQTWKYIERNAGNKTMMRTLYSSLSPRGRVAVKTGLMKEAFEQGIVSPAQGGAKVFSPGRVASYLEDKLVLADQFLAPQEAKEFRGMVKLFRAIQRSGQTAENPPTGARALLPALIIGSYWSPKSAALIGGGLLTAKALFTTEASMKLLATLAELPLDHPKVAGITNEIAASLRQHIPGSLVQPTIQEEE